MSDQAQVIDRIELTKTEGDELATRDAILNKKVVEMNTLRSEIIIVQREGSMYINEIIAKHGQAGFWRREGNFLVKVPEEKKEAENATDQGTHQLHPESTYS